MYFRLMLIGILLISASAIGQVTDSGDLAAHVDSIVVSLPDETLANRDKYVAPTTLEQNTWRQIIQYMIDKDYSSAHTAAGTLHYEVVEYTDTEPTPNRTYYVLQRTATSTDKYWGTFIFNPNPMRSDLVIEAPHPLDNRNTGQQGFLVFKVANAWMYCVAGAHKCNSSAFSPCDGDNSTSCSETPEPYRAGDQAHAVDATIQLTTEELLAVNPNIYVIEPHGYTKGAGGPDDPDIIMSNGSRQTPPNSLLVQLRDALAAIDNSLTFKVAHVDSGYSYYIGLKNVQGRLLNEASNPCYDGAAVNSGHFFHLEQAYSKLRDNETNWLKLASAVAQVFAADEVITSAQSGSWTDPATWTGGVVPTQFEDVMISAGHIISVDDDEAACHSVTFGDTASHIDMNANSMLSISGDFTLFDQTHNVFSAGWSATSAFVRFIGSENQTLAGWSTSGGSTSFRDVIVEKTPGTSVATAGTNMRFGIQNSLNIISGKFILGADDDFEARFASSGNLTGTQDLSITVQADGEFRLVNGDGVHWIRSQTGSTPIGKLTIYGYVEITDASSSDISFDDVDVMDGGTLELGLGLTSSGPCFNPDTVMVYPGGEILSVSTSDIWFTTAVVFLNEGATYSSVGSTTVFPPTFTNEGKVRYRRDPATSAAQVVTDRDYHDLEFSYNTSGHQKTWTLAADHIVADSLTINNSADVVLSASSPYTLSVGSVLRLTSGGINNSDGNLDLVMADGSSISRATGTISDAPTFAGLVDVRYTSTTTSVTTGPEMPTSTAALRDLTIYSTNQTVSLGNDATVNGSLTLSTGTFDNDGSENDYTLSMADGSVIRRATANLTTAPSFEGSVNVEYISTVSPVTTGFEIPASTSALNNLTVTGNQGVTLAGNMTVNGVLTVSGSELYTDGHTITLSPTASMVEENGNSVRGTVTATRTAEEGTPQEFGGIGVMIDAAAAAPGVTTVVRITGDPQTIDGKLGIARYCDITPAVNTGLNATLVFSYVENDLTGIEEDSLALYSSTNGGASWTYRGGTVDAEANTVTLNGIDSFSRWTLAGVALEGVAISKQSGSWTDPTTWVGNAVPDGTEDVFIMAGHTISVDDAFAQCKNLEFGGDDAHIDMNAFSMLTIYGDMSLYSETQNVFSAGWSPDSAFVRFAGGALQTLSGWSTTGSSTSFRDLIIEKDSGTVVTTGGNSMRFGVQNSFEIRSGKFLLASGDDFEARWTSSGNLTGDQLLTTTILANGEFELVDDGESATSHWVRSQTGSTPIGKMTVYGKAFFTDASSSDISIAGIDVKAGGLLTLSLGLGSTTSGPEFNPGTVTIDSGGVMLCETTTSLWFDTSIVVLNRGGLFKTTSTTTAFPPTLVNDGRVRYQRNPTSSTTDQVIVDLDYWDVEFSFAGNGTKKLWNLTADHVVADSLEINNTVDLYITADAAHTLTVDSTLRLTSGSMDISDPEVSLQIANGASISRATGTISSAPAFAGVADLRYTSVSASVTTGPELPTGASTLRNLQVYSTDQTVTLGANATVNGELTLSTGTFDNNGAADNLTLTMANGATVRRATGELTAAPAFGPTVDVEYISTVGAVVTGAELPASSSVLRNLSILGNQGVTLGANVTVNGQLHLQDSLLFTDTYLVTLAPAATIVEDSIWAVQGQVQTTRPVSLSAAQTFGGLGLDINAAGAAPGSTVLRRVVGESVSVGGGNSILRRYVVTPTVNAGLNANVVFHYKDRELNGLNEATLQAYASTDGGSTWQGIGGVVDTLANTLTLSGIGQLGQLTLGGPSTGCCIGLRGNVDNDPADIVSLGDLTALIDVLFISLEDPVCPEEADVDGTPPISLGDLTALIDVLFISLNDPLPCP